MATAKERMLALTSLAVGNTARLHFLSITQTGGTGTVIIGGDRTSNVINSISASIKQTVLAIDKIQSLTASIGS